MIFVNVRRELLNLSSLLLIAHQSYKPKGEVIWKMKIYLVTKARALSDSCIVNRWTSTTRTHYNWNEKVLCDAKRIILDGRNCGSEWRSLKLGLIFCCEGAPLGSRNLNDSVLIKFKKKTKIRTIFGLNETGSTSSGLQVLSILHIKSTGCLTYIRTSQASTKAPIHKGAEYSILEAWPGRFSPSSN